MKKWLPMFLFLVAFSFISLEVAKAATCIEQTNQEVLQMDNDVGTVNLSIYYSQIFEIQVTAQISNPLLYICPAPAKISILTDCRIMNSLNNISNFDKILVNNRATGCQRTLSDFE